MTMNKIETNIIEIINEIKRAKTPKSKKEVMEKHKESKVLQNLLYYTMNPYLRYGISKKMFEKYEPNGNTVDSKTSFYSLLDELAQTTIHDALRY